MGPSCSLVEKPIIVISHLCNLPIQHVRLMDRVPALRGSGFTIYSRLLLQCVMLGRITFCIRIVRISYYCLSLGRRDSVWLHPPPGSAGEKRIRLARLMFKCVNQPVGFAQAIYESLLLHDHTGGLATITLLSANISAIQTFMFPAESRWHCSPSGRLGLRHRGKRLHGCLVRCHSAGLNCWPSCNPWNMFKSSICSTTWFKYFLKRTALQSALISAASCCESKNKKATSTENKLKIMLLTRCTHSCWFGCRLTKRSHQSCIFPSNSLQSLQSASQWNVFFLHDTRVNSECRWWCCGFRVGK